MTSTRAQKRDYIGILPLMREESQCGAIDRRTGERRQYRKYTFWDHRSGFDRRACDDSSGAGILLNALLCLRRQPKALLSLLAGVNVLNIADYALTMNALANGYSEGNPIMDFLIAQNPVWAGIFKVAAVLLASALVYRLKRYRKALIAALLMLALFIAIFAWHIYGLAVMN